MGTPATKWEYRYLVFGLLNTHTLLVSKLDPVRPVRYEMKGYDSLMASYYDNYVLEYISFEEWKPDLEKFELPKGELLKNFFLVRFVFDNSVPISSFCFSVLFSSFQFSEIRATKLPYLKSESTNGGPLEFQIERYRTWTGYS